MARQTSDVVAFAERFAPYAVDLVKDGAVDETARLQKLRIDAARARIAAGSTAWNAWALGVRKALNDFGPVQATWASRLVALDFTAEDWPHDVDFAGAIFPVPVSFRDGAFHRNAYFNACKFLADADFAHANFAASWFENCEFAANATFASATWKGAAEFRSARLLKQADFSEASFGGDLWAVGSTFGGDARFSAAHFAGEGGFGRVRFASRADFSRARFSGGAGFEETTFEAGVSFNRAIFERKAWFRDCAFRGPTHFDLARFQGGFDFTGAQCAPGDADAGLARVLSEKAG